MKVKEFQERAIRHGEIVLLPIDKFPDGLEKIESGRKVIVGHSESGHHHVAVAVCDADSLTLLRPVGADSNDLYLEVSGAARIEHLKPYDRHETKPVAPGYYHINTKMAHDYFLKRAVRVID
jgi:hypothetical protein